MSEKRYIITAKTKGKEPKVLFLNSDFSWGYGVSNAFICLLPAAKSAAKDEPTHCFMVEAKADFLNSLYDFNKISFDEFRELADKFNCKTISTRKEKKPKTQDAPEVQHEPTLEVCGESKKVFVAYRILDDGSKCYYFNANLAGSKNINGQPANLYNRKGIDILLKRLNTITAYVWICDEIEPQETTKVERKAKPEPTPEEKREYVLYRNPPYTSGFEYYSQDGGETFDKSFAKVMTFTQANEKINELSAKGEYQWIYRKIDTKQETPTPEAAPAPKKRIGYVLFGELIDNGAKIYRHETKIVALLNAALDDTEPADVYMTKEQAEFIAYTVNKCEPEFVTWQVEQIEF
jgi:hypothetical protein